MLMSQEYDILVDFNDVHVGVVSKKILHIHDLPKTFKVKRFIPYTHMKIPVFNVRKKLDSYTVECLYYPTVSFTNHVGYFHLIDDDEIKKVLCLKGNCIGPVVVLSSRFVEFYLIPNKKIIEKRVEIKNTSLVPTNFQILIDNTNSVFTCDPIYGELPPMKHKYIKISFNPRIHGTYFLQILCLLKNQDPVYIEARGLYSRKKDANLLEIQTYTKVQYKLGYENYMSNKILDRQNNSIFFIENKNMNFGNTYSPDYKPELTGKFHNISEKCMLIQFDNKTDIFEPVEKFYQLFPGEIADFDIKFKPPHEDAFYYHKLYAKLYLYEGLEEAQNIKDGHHSYFPISFRINAIGYAFSKNYSWIPQVQHPKTVLLPLTVPGCAVYNSFMIENNSVLPTLFKIKAPNIKDSHYCVKPEQGLITGHFQTLIVKFDPKNIDENCIITEEWEIEFNGEMDRRKVVFKTPIEQPHIMFGEDNNVNFGFIYPGCRKKETIMMINHSGHNFNFGFINLDDVVTEPASGYIRACEAIPITISYKTNERTICKTLKCEMTRLLTHDTLFGEPHIFRIQITGATAYGKLFALPRSYDMGKIVCLEEETTTFILFNYGRSDIHFSLSYVANDENDYEVEEWVEIIPDVGTCVADGNVEVTVKIKPTSRGTFKGCIRYQIRVREDSNEIVDNKNPVWTDGDVIFDISFICFYPTLQFSSIVDNASGHMFSKIDLWEMLQIPLLNNVLDTINHDETKVHYLHLPNAEHSLNIKKQLVLILENNEQVASTCKFVRKKICDCPIEEKKVSISKTEKVYNCAHRSLVNIKIEYEEIIPESYVYVTMDMSYDLEGLQTVCFRMLLSQNRCVELMFKMTGLKPDGSILSPYTWNLEFVMREVCIMVKRPGLQAYWFYNNTQQGVDYNFDTTILDEFNKKYGKQILNCINPVGRLEAKSFCPIYFKFAPVNFEQFDFLLPMTYAGKQYNLKMICKGVPFYKSIIQELSGKGNIKDYYYPNVKVILSEEYFAIGPILPYTRVTRLFFMKNIHNHTIGFSFDEVVKKNILELSVCPQKGLIKPDETISCILKICTFGHPSTSRTLLNCFLVDYTQLLQHIESKETYTKMGLTLQHEFTISDKHQKEEKIPSISAEIISAPKVFQVGLSIAVDIASIVDRDIKIDLSDQESLVSYREMITYRRCQLELLIPNYKDKLISSAVFNFNKKVTQNLKIKMVEKKRNKSKCNDCEDRKALKSILKDDECFVHVHTAMEVLIGELLSSDIFTSFIKQVTRLQPLYYPQFQHEPGSKERMRNVRDILNIPPNWILSMIMEKLILDCLLQHFNFDNIVTASNIDFKYESNQSTESVYSLTSDQARINLLKNVYTERFMFLLENL